MMGQGVAYTIGSVLIAALVAVLGVSILGRAGAPAVGAGVSIGLVLQVLLFWVLFVWAFPQRLLLAYGLGVAARFVVVVWVALVWAPRSGLSVATILFSLVAVLFLSTLLEPVFLKPGRSVGARAATT